MSKYTYEAVVTGNLYTFTLELEKLCDGDKGRVVASNAYWDNDEKQTMYYGLVQVFNYSSDNPDYQVLSELGDISSNTSNIS